nr:4-(cytidine 5'-diphospho)-2-C-methyl-D-erythritol kinase [uncultured Celeribacter sp.]
MIKVFAPAKVNLTLHVTGQREDGYHLLDSLVVFVDVGDQITAELAAVSDMIITGRFGDGLPTDGRNLVMQAAALLDRPMALTLDKRLPPASGIGGGSADAAATLRAGLRLGATPPAEAQILALGADVPVCMRSKPARMQGIGERVTPLQVPGLHMVLVNPRVEVSTPQVFRGLETKTNPAMPEVLPEWTDGAEFIDWLTTQRNDLEPPAVAMVVEIAAALSALCAQPGAKLARMSGSGATCFGLFPDRYSADVAALRLQAENPWWWVSSASTLPG